MKKKLLGGLLVVAIAAVAAFNMSFNTQESEMSALMLANVEALAQEYGGELPGISVTCPQPTERYGNCRTVSRGISGGFYYALCVKSDDPKKTCSKSDEGVV